MGQKQYSDMDLSALTGAESATLYVPEQSESESIDALITPSVGLQVTLNSAHPIKVAGLYLVAQVSTPLNVEL